MRREEGKVEIAFPVRVASLSSAIDFISLHLQSLPEPIEAENPGRHLEGQKPGVFPHVSHRAVWKDCALLNAECNIY